MSSTFKLNRAGVKELLKGSEMQSVLQGHGEQVVSRCGDGYASSVHVESNRAKCTCYTDTPDAMRDNVRHNTLLKALR